MFSKHRPVPEIGREQHEQLEYAQQRIRQKKRLYTHFVIFLIGAIFLLLINKILKYGVDYDWALWVILFWAFLLVWHLVDVFVVNKFMGTEWERRHREVLVAKQRERIASLQKEIETEFPASTINKKDG